MKGGGLRAQQRSDTGHGEPHQDVAVGDDWQAINAFAGAETRFFREFQRYFGGTTVGVTTNHRSAKAIVSFGNSVMSGKGLPAKCFSPDAGEIQTRTLNEIWIEFRSGEEFAHAREADSIFLGPTQNDKPPGQAAQRKAKALKACSKFSMESPGQDLLLLARTNRVYGQSLEDLREQLDRLLEHLCKEKGFARRGRVKAMTAHGSKGQQSATVIILDTTTKQFPKIHPDNLLFVPFGVTPEVVIEEERRLFYVAVTRAEKRLLILTEKEHESPFLKSVFSGLDHAPLASSEVLIGNCGDTISTQISRLVETYGGYRPIPQEDQHSEDKTAWSAIRADVDPRLATLIDLLEKEGLPFPAVAYELPDEEVEAVLAWPDAPTPVAILLVEQREFEGVWKARGYKVPPHDLPHSDTVRGIKHYIYR
jgi:superfamily I DNA/RNA helicase